MEPLLKYRKTAVFFVLACFISAFVLAACEGTAFVDINFDATEGVGNIVITGDQNQPAEPQTEGNAEGNTSMSQILLFGLVVALLLGTVAIVISLSRRPRPE